MRTPPPRFADQLLEIGEQLLNDPELRLEDVARTLGTSRARMYYYFAGVADLRTFLIAEHAREAGALVAAAGAAPGSAADRLRAVVVSLVGLLGRRPGLCAGLLADVGSPDAMATHDTVVAEPLRAAIAAGVADGTLVAPDPALAADVLAGGLLLGVLGHVRRHGRAPDAAAAGELADQLLGGLTGPGHLRLEAEAGTQPGA